MGLEDFLVHSEKKKEMLIKEGVDPDKRMFLNLLSLLSAVPLAGSRIIDAVFHFDEYSFPKESRGISVEEAKEIFSKIYERVFNLAIQSELDPEIAMNIFILEFQVALFRAGATEEQIDQIVDDIKDG